MWGPRGVNGKNFIDNLGITSQYHGSLMLYNISDTTLCDPRTVCAAIPIHSNLSNIVVHGRQRTHRRNMPSSITDKHDTNTR